MFLGSRGSLNFDLTIESRAGAHHSGNWGGLISNAGIQLAHAIASIVSPTGQIRIAEWVPGELPTAVLREGLGIMTGLYWDRGSGRTPHAATQINAYA